MKSAFILSIAVLCLVAMQAVMAKDNANQPLPAAGSFTVEIDFNTLTLMPVGANCVLEVEGIAIFVGTLEGTASGKTKALVFGPCAEVAVSPPGTFRDVFKSKMVFAGLLDGEAVFADITYQGETQVGGGISALMHLSNGLKGKLQVDAVVAVGGSYDGFIIN